MVGGSANFNLILPSGFAPGSDITATATDASGNTSAFSTGIVGTGIGGGFGPPTLMASGSSPTIDAGQTVTDTFTISNTFTNADTGVVFTDPIPSGTTFVSGTVNGQPVTFAGGVVSGTIGMLAPNQTVLVTVVLQAGAGAVPSFTNTGTVMATAPPVAPGSVTASVTTNVVAAADLAVSMTGPSGPTLVGQNLVYVVTVTNNGPSDATGVILTDTLPVGTVFISATPDSGPAPTLSRGVLTDAYGALPSGSTFKLTLIVAAGVVTVPTATNTATVSANQADDIAANNTASFSSVVSPLADVGVTVTASPQPVNVGGLLTYTVTVTNIGPSAASGVLLNDVLPASVTFVSVTADSGPAPVESAGTVTDAIDVLAAGQSVVVTIMVMPTAASPPSITDNATVISSEADPNTANNSASVQSTVVPVADLSIVALTAAPNPATEGSTVTITFVVTNYGPSTSTAVEVTETLPAGLIFLSGSADGGAVTAASGTVNAPVGDLAPGASSTVTIVASVATTGPLTVSATTASASVTDPNPVDNTALVTFQAVSIADLAVTLSGPAGPLYTGDPISYTAVVNNNGPSPASNVIFSSPLFPGATFVSIVSFQGGQATGTPGGVSGGVAFEPIGTLAAGASITVVLTVIPTQAGTVVDTANVMGSDTDPNPANNSASVSTVLIVPQSLIQFSASSYVVNSDAGNAAITLTRSGYEKDDVTVHFTTFGGNGTPGADYSPVSVTVDFPPGSTTETVLIPILNNLFNNKNVVVGLQIDTPTGTAILQPGGTTGPARATLTIIDVHPDLVGPTVTDLKLTGHVNDITSIEVDTSGHLDPSTASDPANYTITALGAPGKGSLPFGTVVAVAQAAYNPATGAIYLILSRPLPANELFVVVVNGSRPGAITDVAGNPLNSIFGSVPGSDYTLLVARGTNITYHDDVDVAVTLKLTGPGTMDIQQFPAGQIQKLQVLGGVAHKTVITGISTPQARRSTIGEILGLGQFGSIRLKLTTPPFYVTNLPYPNLQTQFGQPAEDTLLPTPPPPPKPPKHAPKPKAVAPSTLKAASVETAGTPASAIVAISVPNTEAVPVAPKAKVTVTGSKHPHAAMRVGR